MVVCNKGCNKSFSLSEANMKSEYIGKNKKIRRYFLECPHCGKQYTGFFTDATSEYYATMVKAAEDNNNDVQADKYRRLMQKRMLLLRNSYGAQYGMEVNADN